MPPFIIGVAGAGSGSGKTALACLLLERLKGWGAIKYSPSGLYSSVTDDPGVLAEEGKDTARMLQAGAAEVLWVRAAREDRRETLEMAVERLSHLRGIVVEGNGAIEVLSPDIVIFTAVNMPGRASKDASGVIGASDVVVFESEIPPGAPEGAAKFPAAEAASCVDYVLGVIRDKGD